MNYVAIVLAIIVILLVYLLYSFFLLKSTVLTKSASLNATNPGIKIENSPTSTRYAYGIWIYVNSWDTSIDKSIFDRGHNIKLIFDKSAPVLKLVMAMSDNTAKTMEITDNFPLQKWAYIVISVDNQYVDAYIDGKLIKSGRMFNGNSNPISVPKTPTNVDMIIGGGTTFDAYISKFKHWSEPIDPQIVWSAYMEGNGQGSMQNYISSYGIDMSIIKDNIEQTKYKIF